MEWSVLRHGALIVTGVVYGLLATIALRAGLFGLWLGILVLLSLWRYAYEVLRVVAQGRREIPPPDIQSFNPVGEIVLVLHFFAFPGVVILASQFQPLGSLVALLAVFVFPASAGVMGLTSSLTASLDPVVIGAFIKALGRDYLMLVLGCVGVTVAAGLIVSQLGAVSFLLGMMFEIWAFLAIFALIGSSLRAHRLKFDIPGEMRTQEEWDAEQREREWRATLDRAYASIRSGLVESGYRGLRELVADNGDSVEINYWLFENMLDWEDKRHALEVAAKLIQRLVADGDLVAALELYTRTRQVSSRGTGPDVPGRPAGRFADAAVRLLPDVAAALAGYAQSVGRHGVASELGSAALGQSSASDPSTGSGRPPGASGQLRGL